MKGIVKFLCLFFVLIVFTGCGYTTGSLLPSDLNSIHIDSFKNKIDPSREVSDKRPNYEYRPGLEVEITNKVINQFILDKALAVKSEKDAALLLKGELIDYRHFPLSYDGSENVDQFRLEIYVSLELYDNKTGKIMWREPSFMGQTDYYISGPNSKTENAAVKDGVEDLAKRIVERTVETW